VAAEQPWAARIVLDMEAPARRTEPLIERISVSVPTTKTKPNTTAPTTRSVLPVPVPTVNYEDQLLSRAHTAAWLGVTPDCLSAWARQTPPRGPRALRVGEYRIRYRLGDILHWLDSKADVPTIPCKRRRQRAAEQKSA
jgi:hypothetical protein